MKRDIRAYRWLLAAGLLLGAAQTSAEIITETEFSEPGVMCFKQTSLHDKSNKWDSVMLNHHIIVSKEDHFKSGLIFVMFRLKSQPEKLWLYDGMVWRNIEDTVYPLSYSLQYDPRGGFGKFKLHPVMRVTISRNPIDLSPYVDDGEIWVGYGLLNTEADTFRDSFDEMLRSNRFEKILEIGKGYVPRDDENLIVHFSDVTICLHTTGMTKIDDAVSTLNPITE